MNGTFTLLLVLVKKYQRWYHSYNSLPLSSFVTPHPIHPPIHPPLCSCSFDVPGEVIKKLDLPSPKKRPKPRKTKTQSHEEERVAMFEEYMPDYNRMALKIFMTFQRNATLETVLLFNGTPNLEGEVTQEYMTLDQGYYNCERACEGPYHSLLQSFDNYASIGTMPFMTVAIVTKVDGGGNPVYAVDGGFAICTQQDHRQFRAAHINSLLAHIVLNFRPGRKLLRRRTASNGATPLKADGASDDSAMSETSDIDSEVDEEGEEEE